MGESGGRRTDNLDRDDASSSAPSNPRMPLHYREGLCVADIAHRCCCLREPNWNVYAPLVYAPLLPLLRLSLNGRVNARTRDAVFFSAVFCALAHAGYVMSSDSTMSAGGASGSR